MAHTCVAFNSLIFSSNPTSSSDSHKLSFSSRFVFSYPFLFFILYICLFRSPFGRYEKLGKMRGINKFSSGGGQVSLNWVRQLFVPALVHEIRNFLFSWEPSRILCSFFLEDMKLMINFIIYPICRKFTKLFGSERRLRVAPVKAVSSGGFWAPEKSSRQGIWSVR